jgi:hypothetical protein
MRQKKTAQITFRIDPNLKEAAGKAAALERRSLTSLIEKVFQRAAFEIGKIDNIESRLVRRLEGDGEARRLMAANGRFGPSPDYPK